MKYSSSTSTTGSNISTSSINIQQQRKCIYQTIQYSPIFDANEHDTVGDILCSVIQILHDNHTTDINHDSNSTASNSSTSYSIADLKNAITKVMIWKNRVVSQHIAHAIDSTVSIVQVILRDTAMTTKHHSNSTNHDTTAKHSSILTTNELRHLYSSTIVRCINGLADVLQQSRSVATSIANLCADIGIPKYIVAIRHEATHNQLPSLCILRMVSKTLLQYLHNVYWKDMQVVHGRHPYEHAQHYLLGYEIALQRKEEEDARLLQEKQRQKQVLLSSMETEVKHRNSHNSNADDDKDDDDDNTGDEMLDDEMIVDGLYQSIPGTTSNRFAVLLLENNSKKRTTLNKPSPKKMQSPPKQKLPPRDQIYKTSQTPRRKKQKTDRTSTVNYTNNTEESNDIDIPNEYCLPAQQRPFPYTVATCAKAYVQLHHHQTNPVSMDISQTAAMDHILQQTKLYVLRHTNDDVVFVTPSQGRAVEQQQHTKFLFQYRPLLGSIARIWPGFCVRFLSQCVQEIVRGDAIHPNHDPDRPSRRNMPHEYKDCYGDTTSVTIPVNTVQYPLYAILIEGWIHLFLSKNFLQQIDVPPSLAVAPAPTRPGIKKPDLVSLIYKNENCVGSLQLFRQLQYPLNRFYDQIVNGNYDDDNSVREQILDLLRYILGEEQSTQYDIPFEDAPPKLFKHIPSLVNDVGIDNTTNPSITTAVATPITTTGTRTTSSNSKSNILSLEDMEALLGHVPTTKSFTEDDVDSVHKNKTSNHNNNSMSQETTKISSSSSLPPLPVPNVWVSQWVQCSTWEPCAIGTTLI